ncbi:hypothetical protein RSAG8_09109, partial [Rhizoctonia solani AG-8 WAC10335]
MPKQPLDPAHRQPYKFPTWKSDMTWNWYLHDLSLDLDTTAECGKLVLT